MSVHLFNSSFNLSYFLSQNSIYRMVRIFNFIAFRYQIPYTGTYYMFPFSNENSITEFDVEIWVNGVTRLRERGFTQSDKNSPYFRTTATRIRTIPGGGGNLIYKYQNFQSIWLHTVLYKNIFFTGPMIFNASKFAPNTNFNVSLDGETGYYPTLCFSKQSGFFHQNFTIQLYTSVDDMITLEGYENICGDYRWWATE